MKLTIHGSLGEYQFNPQEDAIQLQGKFNLAFKGKDEQGRPVLIKILHHHLQEDPLALDRFVNEYRLRVEHPGIITAKEYVQQHGRHHIIRPWVEGQTLAQRIHRLKPSEAITLTIRMLEALAALHQQRVLHLDMQPKNIILGHSGEVYITDLGLASRIGEAGSRRPFNVYYSAPEQILNCNDLLNNTTDLYAVGMILFEMLAGYKPHHHENPEVLMNLMLAVPIANDGIHPELFSVIQRALSKPRFPLPPNHYTPEQLHTLLTGSQEQRYTDATTFANALKAVPHEALHPQKWWKFW